MDVGIRCKFQSDILLNRVLVSMVSSTLYHKVKSVQFVGVLRILGTSHHAAVRSFLTTILTSSTKVYRVVGEDLQFAEAQESSTFGIWSQFLTTVSLYHFETAKTTHYSSGEWLCTAEKIINDHRSCKIETYNEEYLCCKEVCILIRNCC